MNSIKNTDIWNRKIILFGNEQMQLDFKYLFGKLDIEQIPLGSDLSFTKKLKNFLIVVCEQEKNSAFEIAAQKYGLNCGTDYVYIRDFFLYYNPMFLERGKRELAVWGTGASALELWKTLDKKGIVSEIDFYIDNARDKSIFKGKPVVSPLEIKDRTDVYIIVATREYQWEIYRQAEEYGFQQTKDYIHYSAVTKNYNEMIEKVCFAEKRYPYDCLRPFGYCDLVGDNLYFCCPDFLPISAGSMRYETFMGCWNSYAARVMRLSICNKTYAFCNKQYCDLFCFDEDSEIYEKTELDYERSYSEYPKTLMVAIDHSCNLRCPSCRKEAYIATAEERIEISREAEDLLENVVPYVDRLWLAGSGEVFVSPIYRGILNDDRCQNRTSISILSNGTLFDENNWKLIKDAYRSIEVVISMDGIRDETIERLRKGADAKELKRNIEFLGELRKGGKINKLFISCVLQADNVEEIYDLLEYCRAIGVDKVQFLKLHNHGVYLDNDEYDRNSVYDQNGFIKDKYKCFFKKELLMHPLADWFNNADQLGVEKRDRLDRYEIL